MRKATGLNPDFLPVEFLLEEGHGRRVCPGGRIEELAEMELSPLSSRPELRVYPVQWTSGQEGESGNPSNPQTQLHSGSLSL